MSEQEIYSAILKWLKDDSPNRAPNLSELMSYINMPLIDIPCFTRNVAREQLMRKKPECFNIVMEAMDYHMGIQCEKKSSSVVPRKQFLYILVMQGYFKDLTASIVGVCCIDNLIYIRGGRIADKSYSYKVEKSDPENDVYASSTSMKTKRRYFTLAADDNRIYGIGGLTDGHHILKSIKIFDPGRGKWTDTSPMSKPRGNHGVRVLDGYIYLSNWIFLGTF